MTFCMCKHGGHCDGDDFSQHHHCQRMPTPAGVVLLRGGGMVTTAKQGWGLDMDPLFDLYILPAACRAALTLPWVAVVCDIQFIPTIPLNSYVPAVCIPVQPLFVLVHTLPLALPRPLPTPPLHTTTHHPCYLPTGTALPTMTATYAFSFTAAFDFLQAF